VIAGEVNLLAFSFEAADGVFPDPTRNVPVKVLSMRSTHVPLVVRAFFGVEDAVRLGAFLSQSVVITSQMPKEPPPGAGGPNGGRAG